MSCTLVTDINLDTLADQMSYQISTEELFDFIVQLDGYVADWDFTEMIYEWAREQHKEFLAEREDIERQMRGL